MKLRGPLGTLLKYEVLQVLRDRRTVLIAVVAPLILYPLIIVLGRMAEEQADRALESRVYEYAVAGPGSEWGREILRRAANLPPERVPASTGGDTGGQPDVAGGAEERDGDGGNGVGAVGPGGLLEDVDGEAPGPGAYRLEERAVPAPDSALQAGEVDLVVHVRRNLATDDGSDTLSTPLFTLRYRTGSDFSRAAYRAMDARLRRLRAAEREDLLRSRGFPVDLDRVAAVETRNLATSREQGGAVVGMILTPLMVMLMMGGGALVAADAISGEKERGTLETLLTTAATRGEIVTAKLLSIAALGLVVTVVNLANLLAYVGLGLIEIPEPFALELPPEAVAVLFLLYLPVVFLVASVLLAVSGYARSYKEYQIYAIPLTFLFLLPALAAALPGVDLRSVVAAVPLAGVSVGVREVLVGEYDWAFLALAFASSTGAATWLTRVTAGFLSRERLVTPGDLDMAELAGGEPLFRKRVLRWFGILWVLLLVNSLWLFGDLGIRAQVLVNLVGIFLGGSLVMIHRYDLDVRKALALRAPHPAVWIAVVVGVPAAQLTGIAVSRAAEFFFPVPEEVMEAFGQYLLPEGLPLWQVLFFLCVLPGVCEEIAFRGVLLYGLRKKLRPVRLALTVGLIFGLFHVDLFRILPTAYLGVVLTAVVLLSGSILPAMAWHGLNNAFALVSADQGWSPESAPPSLVWLGAAGLAVSGWILWRTRRPYPDLRGSRGAGDGMGGGADADA
ncbi:MAG: ABC transporter permease subunit/CPBP intramembrane protease [Longimicrobiales bacterium]|nr:ABC transporter permease subunit/CPBP intramembrane protease [Longimicrobiales bacterium]